MAKSSPQTVDDYIASQPEAAQPALTQVRNAIRKALPAAEEVISYNIPTYKLDGAMVIYFAGWKHHYSLYPAGARLLAAFRRTWRLTKSKRAPSDSRSPSPCPPG